MAMGLMYWILMLVWLVFGAVAYWPGSAYHHYGPSGNWLMLFLLLFLLGWHCFGPPVRKQ